MSNERIPALNICPEYVTVHADKKVGEVMAAKEWRYFDSEPAADAPISDNPSGLYCPVCRALGGGTVHCAYPEECGQMRHMKPKPADEIKADGTS